MDEERYDRQLRLWGKHGQEKLSCTSILCVGSSTAACEVLKNLILPGIGSFHIVDDAVVTDRDLSMNFFLEKDDLGKLRSEYVCAKLIELNPACAGTWSSSFGDASRRYDIVVSTISRGSGRRQHSSELIAESVHAKFLIEVDSIGFIGRFRIFARSTHVVLEPKLEEGRIDDFRLANPWKELREFYESFFEQTEKELGGDAVMRASHIPYFAIMWKAHQSVISRNRKLLTESMAVVKHSVGLHGVSAVNFDEAVDNLFRFTAVVPDEEIVKDLESMIETHQCMTRENDNVLSDVIAVLAAVVGFYHDQHCLPLSVTSLPDMTSLSESYTRLVGLFKAKFEADVTNIQSRCGVATDLVSMVVRNCRTIRLIDFPRFGACASGEDDTPHSPPRKRTCEHDQAMCPVEGLEPDQAEILAALDGHLDVLSDDSKIKQEFQRYKLAGDSSCVELHAVSSVIGSAVAQEIVKLVTHQFAPVEGSWVFNGMNGSAFFY